MPCYTLNVSEPADDYDDDAPSCLVPPGDRWCSLWGPRGPCHPSIEGTAHEWLLIAGAIEAGAPRAFKRVGFEPLPAGGWLWSPRNSTGERDHVILAAADLLDLAKSIRDQLAPTVSAPRSRPPGGPTSSIVDQPPPVPSDRPAIWPLVIADMHERDQLGRARYGTPLQAHNGRRPLVDAYQEILDLAVYLRQEIEERNDLATGLRALAARWRQGSAAGDDRTAADCADEIDALLAGGAR